MNFFPCRGIDADSAFSENHTIRFIFRFYFIQKQIVIYLSDVLATVDWNFVVADEHPVFIDQTIKTSGFGILGQVG